MSEMKEKQFRLRLPESLYTILEERAKRRFRSVNSQMLAILTQGLAEYKAGRSLPTRGLINGPEKGYALRIPGELYVALEAWAQAERRALNGQIVVVLEASVTPSEGNVLESIIEDPVPLLA